MPRREALRVLGSRLLRRVRVRRLACVAVSVACLTGCSIREPSPKLPGSALPALRSGVLSHADAIADLDFLLHTLENVHPNPYGIRSKDAVLADRQILISRLPEPVTRFELWSRLSRLVASLGDGHSALPVPIDMLVRSLDPQGGGSRTAHDIARGMVVFPVDTALDDRSHLVVTVVHGTNTEIERGDRLLSVNGHDADALLADWVHEISGDSDASRAADVSNLLWMLLQIHSMPAPYLVTVLKSDGAERTVMLAGVPMDAHASARTALLNAMGDFTYRILQPRVGYMNFYSMAGSLGRFKQQLRVMFREFADDSIDTLVIDVRGNGGGDDALGEELLRYVTDKPYRLWARGEWKRSAEMRSYGKQYLPAPTRWLPFQYVFEDGRRLYRGPVGSYAIWDEQPVKVRKRAEPFFTGAVCVLTGPHTYSAAVVFADAIKTYHLATLIGEDTGGHPNFFSQTYDFLLPRSGLEVQVSTASWVRASGDAADPTGVVPDVVVRTTIDDIRRGADPVLERAKSCAEITKRSAHRSDRSDVTASSARLVRGESLEWR